MTAQTRAKLWSGITLASASVMLVSWVLFRFASTTINFDLVGQQLLSRQWLSGNLEGAVIGPTNYILKMLLFYMPAELLGMSPKVFLVVSAIAVNIITFIGIYMVIRRILGYFAVETESFFNCAMLWLGAVAGSVFWVQFTNSRNLELLAGLLLLYLGLLLYRQVTYLRCVVFVVLAGLTYFSDPLQLFVTSGILVLYVCGNSFLFENERRREPIIIVTLIVAGYLLSHLLALLVRSVTGIEIITMEALSQSLAVIHHIPTVVMETAKNIARLVAGTNEMGIWRQVLNIVLVGCLAVLAVFSLIQNSVYKERRSLVLFTALMLLVPIGVYSASGQAIFGGDTSRYLIVLAPALIILFSLSDMHNISVQVKKRALFVIVPLLLVNAGSLLYSTFGTVKDEGILRTAHLESHYMYLEEKGFSYGYASMDAALPATYILGRGKDIVLLPLSCEGTLLRKATLFFDKNVFTNTEKQNGKIPIILDGNSIDNYPSVCSVEVIRTQLGEPVAVEKYGGRTILLYRSAQLSVLGF